MKYEHNHSKTKFALIKEQNSLLETNIRLLLILDTSLIKQLYLLPVIFPGTHQYGTTYDDIRQCDTIFWDI